MKAQVIDMETAAVADRGERAGSLPRRARDQRRLSAGLADRSARRRFDASRGRATPLRLLGYLATRPREIKPFKEFVQGLSLARANLTKFLEQLNAELPANW